MSAQLKHKEAVDVLI